MFLEVKKLRLSLERARWLPTRGGGIVEDATWHGLVSPLHKMEKLQIDLRLMWDLPLALGSNDVARSREILPGLSKLTRPHYARFREVFNEFIAKRQEVVQHIHKMPAFSHAMVW
jgi:hypothetical protein